MKVILLAVLVVICSALSEQEYQKSWEEWKWQNKKFYTAEGEEEVRYNIFKNNLHYVNTHNKAGKHSYTLAMNSFGDLSNLEFTQMFNRLNKSVVPSVGKSKVEVNPEAPDSWDWRTKGAVTGVKDQGQCGSCWSFSTTGSVEGAWFLKRGQLVSLSEQNLVDCSTPEGNNGCNGGLMDSAFKYIINNKGIDTESSYPYTATGPNACRFNPSNVGATISSYRDVNSGDENDLMNSVYMTPVSVAIDASRSSFQLYHSGVYYEPSCSSTSLDHGVLAVGYGSEGGSDYWIVKNSWGSSWGNNGYILMSRNKNNNCGIATMSSYPIV